MGRIIVDYCTARIAANPVSDWRFLYTTAALRLDRSDANDKRKLYIDQPGRAPPSPARLRLVCIRPKPLTRTSSRREFREQACVPFAP
jgi:hypothetical protein